jgi:hypothetical protein
MRNEHGRLFHCPFASHRGGVKRNRNSENRARETFSQRSSFDETTRISSSSPKNRDPQLSVVFHLSTSADVFQLLLFFKNFSEKFFEKREKFYMAFPPGARANNYKQVYLSNMKMPSPLSSDEEDLSSKMLLFAKKAKTTNKTLFRFDRDIALLEAKQQKLMVEFNEAEEKLKILKRQRQKAATRIEEDNWFEITKARRKVGLPISMVHREAIEPPRKKVPIVMLPESSSSEEEEEEDEEEEEEEEEDE